MHRGSEALYYVVRWLLVLAVSAHRVASERAGVLAGFRDKN